MDQLRLFALKIKNDAGNNKITLCGLYTILEPLN